MGRRQREDRIFSGQQHAQAATVNISISYVTGTRHRSSQGVDCACDCASPQARGPRCHGRCLEHRSGSRAGPADAAGASHPAIEHRSDGRDRHGARRGRTTRTGSAGRRLHRLEDGEPQAITQLRTTSTVGPACSSTSATVCSPAHPRRPRGRERSFSNRSRRRRLFVMTFNHAPRC